MIVLPALNGFGSNGDVVAAKTLSKAVSQEGAATVGKGAILIMGGLLAAAIWYVAAGAPVAKRK